MKIGIDISMLVYQGSGVATYTYNLVKNLLSFDKQNEYLLFYSSLRRPANFNYLQEFASLGGKVYDYRFPPKVLKYCWNQHYFLPVEWLIGKVDFFHSSDFLRPPLMRGTRGITTIHDLTWRVYPQFHTEDIISAHEKKLAKTIEYEDIILVDSLNTKQDLLKFYPDVEQTNKVYVSYLGVDEKFKKITNKAKIAKVLYKYKVAYPKKYLLYVGAIEPRKNLDTAIKIYADLIKNEKYTDIDFLIVGRAGWKNENIFQLVKDLRLQDRVIFTGFVDDQDLPYFYNAASAFVYLSLYEGFGLPPLEAARCGIPSLLYENSSLKEIFPKNYYFAKKNSELGILEKLLSGRLRSLESKVEKFSWQDYSQNFISILTNSLNSA